LFALRVCLRVASPSPGRLDQTKRPRAIFRAVVRPRRPVRQHFTSTRVCTWSSMARSQAAFRPKRRSAHLLAGYPASSVFARPRAAKRKNNTGSWEKSKAHTEVRTETDGEVGLRYFYLPGSGSHCWRTWRGCGLWVARTRTEPTHRTRFDLNGATAILTISVVCVL
jgi:hypothetical protein